MRYATKHFSWLMTLILCGLSTLLFAQRRESTAPAAVDELFSETTFRGLKLRGIGPAFMSGRIADVAIDPTNESTWYVAVGSGGVWKTTNAGVTFTPIFDEQGSYSIGCVTIDPSDPMVIWVGTGEEGGGRHFGFGDGIYRSEDGGTTWEKRGLPDSEHIGKIIVHPDNSDVIFVAAQGPLWSAGGERGFYKSTDAGKNWKRTLGDDQFTGVGDIAIDPRNPDRIYAVTWQRQRTVAAMMDGGVKNGIFRSEDGGETWTQLTNGLPSGKMGKIGLTISPQQPDVVYAAIELDRRTGGTWRSADRGMNWEKTSDVVASATGPHYYMELFASPHQFDLIYMMDASMKYSSDGGKNWHIVNREHIHGDFHGMAFKKSDPNYVMVATDGGLYESFDLTKNWRYMPNLPVTQYYKVSLDDAEPFYNIYAGTQDNGTHGGPSRTDNVQGIQNYDWKLVLNWDGHATATEPGNPDIVYAERQQGTLSRLDMSTGEVVDIQPQAGEDDPHERYNWDAPIHVSPHSPSRLYFASYRVWKSNNRGDSWEAISDDLTRGEDRLSLPIMGATQSWDSPWDVFAMSNYGTITSLSESPLVEGLIYAGTDDGLLQVTEDDGKSWRAVEVSSMGVPERAFINDIKADLHDPNTVYVSLDNHKYGDYRPFVVKSTDRGRTWKMIKGNLPDKLMVWRLVQDHVKPELLFIATEYGLYFSINGGGQWTKLEGGVPTISFRDLAIQKRENDLVGASFGRGFFIFDDYSVLREVSTASLQKEGSLYSTRKAWWYIPRSHLNFDSQKGSQGSSYYVAPNPDFGAVFTYHLKDGLQTKAEIRQAAEKPLTAAERDVPMPSWEERAAEEIQEKPGIFILVQDASGNVIRRVEGPSKKGFHRISWDLRYPAPQALTISGGQSFDKGLMVAPGTYTATLYKSEDGVTTALDDPITFEVERMYKGALEGAPENEVAAFWRSYEAAAKDASALDINIDRSIKTVDAMRKALQHSSAKPGTLDAKLHDLRTELYNLHMEVYGNPAKLQVGEKTPPTIGERLFAVNRGISTSLYGPTETSKQTLQIANKQIQRATEELKKLNQSLADMASEMKNAGAPYIEGMKWPNE
ncbi:VPS10 domain-containing protein [Indibacter alkaliphilus]|uniref:VPS10 domain-containing protein n=1 Tax=Indibacter alkaliphilus TaxID=579922 RepID=UPI0002F42881|nr:glycosyl hydrolase [Indibacter alkaliphilus]